MKVFKILGLILLVPLLLQAEDLKIKVGTPLSPTDRLISEISNSDVEDSFTKAADRMLDHYTDNPNSCLGRKRVQGSGCKLARNLQVGIGEYSFYLCRDYSENSYAGELEDTIPLHSYYVPFQLTETTQTPYDTEFMTADIARNLKAKAEQFLHLGMLVQAQGGSTEPAKGEIDRLAAVKNKFADGSKHLEQQDINEIKNILQEQISKDQGVIDSIKEFKTLEIEIDGKKVSMDDATLRHAISKNGRFMEMHVYPTGFDVNQRNREDYFEDIWTHQGAVNSWVPIKNPVPIWFSEFPEALMTMRFAEQAYGNTILQKLLQAENKMDNCRQQKQDLGSLDTIFKNEGANKPSLHTLIDPSNDNSKFSGAYKCAPGNISFYGRLFSVPINFDKETLYATQAATKRDYVAIKLAYLMGENLGMLNPNQSQEIGKFHDVQFEDEGEHKRDRLQFLDLHRGQPFNRSRNVARNGNQSCITDGQYYLPRIMGERYKDANVNADGERFVSAHYRFVQACPVCYLPIENETIFY